MCTRTTVNVFSLWRHYVNMYNRKCLIIMETLCVHAQPYFFIMETLC